MVRSIRDRSSGCVLHNLIAIEYLQLSQMTTVGRPLSIILNRYSLSKLKERGRREPIARRLEPWPCSLAEAVEAGGSAWPSLAAAWQLAYFVAATAPQHFAPRARVFEYLGTRVPY